MAFLDKSTLHVAALWGTFWRLDSQSCLVGTRCPMSMPLKYTHTHTHCPPATRPLHMVLQPTAQGSYRCNVGADKNRSLINFGNLSPRLRRGRTRPKANNNNNNNNNSHHHHNNEWQRASREVSSNTDDIGDDDPFYYSPL